MRSLTSSYLKFKIKQKATMYKKIKSNTAEISKRRIKKLQLNEYN